MEENKTLNDMQIDVICEMLNISMSSASSAISSILDKKVSITEPRVKTSDIKKINTDEIIGGIAVKITYVEGINGKNIMIFKQRDMQLILNQLMGNNEEPKDDFVFDELSISAACEVMNQMMGASATSLSKFLNRTINISTPEAFVVEDIESLWEFIEVAEKDSVLTAEFDLIIENIMSSNFISFIPYSLAKEIIEDFGLHNKNNENNESNIKKEEPVNVKLAQFSPFKDAEVSENGEYKDKNIGLIMNVPVNVSVQLGKTTRKIKEVLDFSYGTVIELNSQAGAPVDIIVNGELVAKGDVVVIEDNFGVRITEIIERKNIFKNKKD